MTNRIFDPPVFVKNGGILVQEIACLVDAFDFLEKWPDNRRGPIYQTAVRACQRSFDGQISVAVARSAFSGFVRSVGALVDVAEPVSWPSAIKPSSRPRAH